MVQLNSFGNCMQKKSLLLILEALQMNGAIKGLVDFLGVLDYDEWDVDLFLFDTSSASSIISIPSKVNVLTGNVHCQIARRGFRDALKFALKKGRVDLVFKRALYSILQRKFVFFRKWNLARPAARQARAYDVVIGGTMGMTWEYAVNKVTARQKFLWLDTNVHFEPWPEYWRHFSKYVADASALVCVSEATRDMMRRENPNIAGKIHTVNYVIDSARIKSLSVVPSKLPAKRHYRLLTVGRYSEQKGQHLIPGIARILVGNNLKFEWYVIAPGFESRRAEIDRVLRESGLDGVVHFCPGVSNPYAEMAAADLYVQPSVFEGYGLTVSEALVAGRYVVATDIPEFREQITSDKLGLLCVLREDAFADTIMVAVKRLLEGKVATDYITPYSSDRIYRQFLELVAL